MFSFFFFFSSRRRHTRSTRDWSSDVCSSDLYYAELHIYRGDAVIQIDARPSDSIAVALRLKAPIFTSESLLALTSVETGEAGGESGTAPLDPDALKTYLQNLDPEDFGKFTP